MANSPCYSVFFRAKNKAKDDAKDDAKHSAKGVQDSVQELGPDGGCNRLTVNGQCRKCRKKETFSQIILAITRYFRIFAHKFGMSTTKDTVMKRILNLLITLAAVTTAMGATVNRQQARQQAAQFLQQRGAQLGSDPTTVNGRRVQTADQSLYVFNAEGGRGFVVVAGDDRADAILGYTLEGSYDEADMPPAFMEWLAQMEAEIKALGDDVAEARSNAPKASAPQVAIHAAIAPLIQTTWNQGNYNNTQNTDGIYNIRLPKVGERYPCTGCVAVCGAQIMYYYRWPQGPTAEVPGYSAGSAANTSAALPAMTFLWDKMKTSYSSSDAYSDAAYAVAELLLYAGYAAKMKYDVSGSSASQVTLVGGMVDYFGYDPNWKSVSRANYSVAAWDEMIYNELASGRPVIYDGASSADGSGGHAFICDGYDGEGLYHFNWGWGGSRNGYFKLSATNPDGANDFPGYVFGNSAVIGIQPATGVVPTDPNADDEWETVTIEGVVANALSCTLEGTTVSTLLQNPNSESCAFGLGLAELNDDATLNVLDYSYEYYKNWELGSGSYWTNQLTFDLSSYNLPEGKHRLVPVSLLNGEEEWKRCHPADLWFEVNVSGGEMTAVKHPVADLQISRFEMVTSGTPDNWQNVQVSVANRGDNIEKTYYIYVDGEWPRWASSVKTLKIASGNTKTFTLSAGNLSAGTHTLTLRDGYNGPVVAETTVDIKIDLEATAFNIGGDLKFAGSTLPVDVTVESHAGDYTEPLYFFASTSDSKGSPAYIAGTGIPGGGSEDVRFYFTPTSGGTWNFWVATDKNGSNVIGTGSADIEEAPAGTVTLEITDWQYKCQPGGRVEYTATVKNTGSTTNYNGFYGWVWTPLNDGTNRWSGIVYASADKTIIEPGKETTITLTFDGLDENIQYSFDPYYYPTYASSNGVRFCPNFYSQKFTYAAPAVDPDPDPIPGDTNGNGGLDTDDVTVLVSYLTGQTTEKPANADVNGDGEVNIADLTALIKALLKKGEQ